MTTNQSGVRPRSPTGAHAAAVDADHESRQQRRQRRRRTLEQLGEVSINPGPLLSVVRAPADDPGAVSEAIGRCPALAARVLSVANSAALRPRRAIESVHRATIHLGPSRTRAIAMAFGLRIMSEDSALPRDLAQRLWTSSLRKATAGRLACELLDPRHTNAAFCRGLVQDLGLQLLAGMAPSFYEQELVPGSQGGWSQQEVQRFGLDHAEVGQRLLRSWQADRQLHEAVRHHHRPPSSFDGPEALVKVPAFLASLMPHLSEEPTGVERDWLVSLHGQFLAPMYPSPEAFFEAVCEEANALMPEAGTPEPAALRHELLRAVTGDTVTMVSQLCRLESALGRQREGLDELRFHAFTDSLTKVLNRRGFTQLAERRAEDAARRDLGVCCMVIDLDELKPMNDRYGHDAGDLMLRGLAKLLRRNLDRHDLIGRLGGDEFAVLISGVDHERARDISHRLAHSQNKRIRIDDGVEMPLRFSIGAVHVERMDESVHIEDLVTAADEAMYQRKHTDKGGVHFVPYEPSPEAPPQRDDVE